MDCDVPVTNELRSNAPSSEIKAHHGSTVISNPEADGAQTHGHAIVVASPIETLPPLTSSIRPSTEPAFANSACLTSSVSIGHSDIVSKTQVCQFDVAPQASQCTSDSTVYERDSEAPFNSEGNGVDDEKCIIFSDDSSNSDKNFVSSLSRLPEDEEVPPPPAPLQSLDMTRRTTGEARDNGVEVFSDDITRETRTSLEDVDSSIPSEVIRDASDCPIKRVAISPLGDTAPTPEISSTITSALRPTKYSPSPLGPENETVPSPPSATRTPSENPALQAVLSVDNVDCDKTKSKNCIVHFTTDLTDEEIAAVVPPNLRRHRTTPGAVSVEGRVGVRPPETILSSHFSTTESAVPFPDYCDPALCVSATLVTETGSVSECSPSCADNHPPVMAQAVSRWTRPCIVLSMLLVLTFAAIGTSIGLALTYTGVIGNQKGGNTSSNLNTPKDGEKPLIGQPTSPPGMLSSSHAVFWGKVSSCDDQSFFLEKDMLLSCGGTLKLEDVENAECLPLRLDRSRVACRIKSVGKPYKIDTGGYLNEAVATAIFSCIGDTKADRTATAGLSDMQVTHCDSLGNSTRRRLDIMSQSLSPPEASRARAVQQAHTSGGASAFISLGRFCRLRGGGEWHLWHEVYLCELGQRMLTTSSGAIWSSGSAAINGTSENTTATTNSGDLSRLINRLRGGGGRRDLEINETTYAILKAANLNSFCYNINTRQDNLGFNHSNSSDSCTGADGKCQLHIPPIRISDSDPRSSCFSYLHDIPSLQDMWDAAHAAFSSSNFIHQISRSI